ncbi:uncharacterized protein LOC120344376 [Styela clava]|uniref:uncharacterized protein LOC120344376 n=1 Tax=Styela clava TaxID=7725 RepID=UPI0019395883|nr:uncharacterized protein LOC120344376 [Styela clava]XP_039269519.1 uncharacterized protein LOC120344376 [Styela clava]
MAAFPEFNKELLHGNNENTTSMELTCIAERNWFMVAFLPLNSIGIIINLIVLLASMLDREKLQRQNYMFASVNSALLSHVVYLALNIWGAAANVMAQDAPNVLGIPKVMWTVCEAGVASIGFGVVANASSLVYVTIDSTFVAPRFVVDTKAQLKDDKKSKLPKKRGISIILMAVSWIVPIIFITAATLKWNCSQDCWCPSSSFVGEVCPHDFRCSRFLTPMTSSFLLVNIGLWTVQIILLIGMIVKKYIAFKNSTKRVTDHGMPANDATTTEQDPEKNNREIGLTRETTSLRASPAWSNPRFRFAIIITSFLTAAFVPTALSILVDAFKADANLAPAKIISGICLYLYMVMCPFLILKYFPSLRASLSQLLHKVFFCFR